MQEFLTAVWLMAAWKTFRKQRGSKLGRREWLEKVTELLPELEKMRVYN